MRRLVTLDHSVSGPVGGGVDSAKAWRVAVAAALTNGVAFGTVYTFGTFFRAMAEEFDTGLGPTSLVFGITMFLFFGTGAASGFLADRWGPRPLVWIGGAMFSGGLFLTSQVDELWQGYLSYGLGAGLGGGLFIAPVFAAVAAWFERYRAVAQGVAATGNGLGTLLLLPFANSMVEDVGWRDAYLTLAAIAAVAFAIGGLGMARPPIRRQAHAGRHLRSVMRTQAFRRLALGCALYSAGQSTAFAFTVLFATDAGVSRQRAAMLIGIVGAASILGRLLLTGLSNRIGPVRMMQLCYLAQPPAFVLLVMSNGNYTLLIAFAVLFGVAYGGFVALMGQVTAHLFGVVGLGAVLGWVYLMAALGSLLFPPFVGFLADATGGNRLPMLAMLAVVSVGSLAFIRLQREPATVG